MVNPNKVYQWAGQLPPSTGAEITSLIRGISSHLNYHSSTVHRNWCNHNLSNQAIFFIICQKRRKTSLGCRQAQWRQTSHPGNSRRHPAVTLRHRRPHHLPHAGHDRLRHKMRVDITLIHPKITLYWEGAESVRQVAHFQPLPCRPHKRTQMAKYAKDQVPMLPCRLTRDDHGQARGIKHRTERVRRICHWQCGNNSGGDKRSVCILYLSPWDLYYSFHLASIPFGPCCRYRLCLVDFPAFLAIVVVGCMFHFSTPIL